NLAIETDQLIAEGLSAADAKAGARRTFGNVARAQEQFYDSRRAMWFNDLRHDAMHATRMLAKTPGFALVAILTVAIGIGTTTAIFSVVYAVLLRQLPYRDSDRLVYIWSTDRNHQIMRVSHPDLVDWRTQSHTLEDLVAWGSIEAVLTGTAEPERLQTAVYEG